MAKFRVNDLLIATCAVVFTSSLAAAQQPPKLRLPDTVAPTSYRVHLTLDPNKNSFSGHISIRIDIKRATKLIWLNGAGISISQASLRSGNQSLSAKPVNWR